MQEQSNVPPRSVEEGIRPPDDPRYPPQSVLRPKAQRSALITFVGGLTLLAALVGLALVYWTDRDKGRVDPTAPQAVGTGGTAPGGVGRQEGGFDPQRPPENTRDEIESRGASGTSQGSPLGRGSSGLAGGNRVLTRIEDVVQQSPASVAGRQVDLRDIAVESGTGRSFRIHDGNARVDVVANGDARVTPGDRVDVQGVAESDPSGGVRVRAQQVVIR